MLFYSSGVLLNKTTLSMKTSQKIYLPFKRLIGIIGSLVGIIFCFVLLWWWIIPINAILTKGHPFFARHRIGQNGKAFRCIKFRTMRLDADPHMSSLEEDSDKYTTKFGRFLKFASMDETPQLFNILVGQMAFIGPRPLVDVNDIDIITVNKRKENGSIVLKPGLSGYAQIHKKSKLDPVIKAEYDYQYLQKFSLFFDMKIFFITIFKTMWM